MNYPVLWIVGGLAGTLLLAWLIYDTFLRKHNLRELVAGKRVTLLLLDPNGNLSPLCGHFTGEFARYADVVSNDLTHDDLVQLGYARMELLEERTNHADYLILGSQVASGEVVFTVLDCCTQCVMLQVHLDRPHDDVPPEPALHARSLFERFERDCYDELLKSSSS